MFVQNNCKIHTELFHFCVWGQHAQSCKIVSSCNVPACAAFDPWESARLRSKVALVADLERCRADMLFQRKTLKNTRERQFGHSVCLDTMTPTGLRISNFVELGEVESQPDEPRDPRLPASNRNTNSPAKDNERTKINILLLTKKKFSGGVSPRERFSSEKKPTFVAALDKILEQVGTRKSGRDCRAVPVFQMTRT